MAFIDVSDSTESVVVINTENICKFVYTDPDTFEPEIRLEIYLAGNLEKLSYEGKQAKRIYNSLSDLHNK